MQVTKAQPKDTTQQQTTQSDETIVHILALASKNFNLTKDMMRIDEDLAQKQLKDVEQIKLVLARIPKKELYNLHMSVTQ
jgi:hypothetical protein